MRIRTTTDATAMPVAVAPGLAYPSKGVRVIATETPNELDIEVLVVVEDGRLVAQEVVVRRALEGPAVSTEGLRAVPVAKLVKYAAQHLMHVQSASEGNLVLDAGPFFDEEFERAKQNGMTDETLRLVARVYRVALLMGNTPTKTVEEYFEVPRSTAGRWVAAARSKGFLEPAAGPGKAGG